MKSIRLSQELFDARESFANNPGAIMGKIVGTNKFAALYASYESTYRRRLFTPLVTLSTLVLQALDADKAQRKAVATMMTHLANNKLPNGSHDASAYCQARQRLPMSLLVEPTKMLAEQMEPQGRQELWHGRHVKLIDGSSFSMPDTPENQAYFGQPSGQKPGCGSPVAKIAGLFSLTTGAALDIAYGPYTASERSLSHQLWRSLKHGDILAGDRYYGTYPDIALLKQRGVDVVFRVHQCREVPRHGPRDEIDTWTKDAKPKWMTQQQFDALADRLKVRIIRVKIRDASRRVRQVVLVTTLLNKKHYPAKDLAGLYERRWEIETDFAHIKTTMAMDVLAAHKPETIIKELWGHMLGYNLIRTMMWEAGHLHNISPLRLSFKGAIQEVMAFGPLTTTPYDKQKPNPYADLLRHIATHKIPNRPGRQEPRVKKRRPKQYPLMTKPRPQLREELRIRSLS